MQGLSLSKSNFGCKVKMRVSGGRQKVIIEMPCPYLFPVLIDSIDRDFVVD